MKRALTGFLDALAARAAGRSLRTGIPILLLAFTLLVSGVVLQYSLRQAARAVETAAVDAITQRANRMESTLETFYRQGLGESVQAVLSALGAESGHRLAAVIDERGVVIAASRGLLLGERAEAALPGLMRDAGILAEAPGVQSRMVGGARLAADGNSVAALFPLQLGLRGGALRAQRAGLLLLEYDLGERKAAAAIGVRNAAWQLAALLVGLALLLWLLLYAMLTRRVRRIVDTMRRVAEADFAARTGISGRDEVAQIAQAFDAMTVSLGEARQALIHQRDHLEEQVAARTVELERANQELEAFSYSASHDLQAPLRAMRGFAGVLLEDYADKLDEDGRDSLQRIDRASQRMSSMVEDLLAFARSTRTALHRTSVDLSERAEEIIQELRERNLRHSFEARIQSGVTAMADASLMQSVLANLLGNAWKYSRESEASCIEFGAETVGGETVYFVRDNGVGFDMAEAARLFEPFQRLHRQDRFEGTGIGLATVWRIIQRHGGRLWADAAPGKGATFRFTLGSEG